MVVVRGPYSCLLFKIRRAYADLGKLVLIYLQCSLVRVFKICLSALYTHFHKYGMSDYIVHIFYSFACGFALLLGVK